MTEEIEHGGLGHNRPPSAAEIAVAELKVRLAELEPRKQQILNGLRSVVVRDRATAGAATDTIGIARDVGAEVERQRMEITRPLDTAIKAAIATATNFWADVQALIGDGDLGPGHPRNKGTAFDALITWKAAENQRRLDQEAEQRAEEDRLRREAAARQSPVSREAIHSSQGDPVGEPPDATSASAGPRPAIDYSASSVVAAEAQEPRDVGVTVGIPAESEIRGDYGYVARKKKAFRVEVIDVTKVPGNILTSPKVIEAICAVAKGIATAQGGGTIGGLIITEITGTRVG
jgi:hypothetical protein